MKQRKSFYGDNPFVQFNILYLELIYLIHLNFKRLISYEKHYFYL